MLVDRVALRDFRNYERADVVLAPGLTVVTGSNGAGKTNLLEALYFGLTARSCRTRNEREMVRHGCRITRVAVDATDDSGAHRFEVGFEPGEAKRISIDGAAQTAAPVAQVQRPPVSVFVPERLELIKGAPALRRSHVDQLIAAIWPARGETRAAYSRALAQRNALIARIRAGHSSPTSLDPWDQELARAGLALMEDRAAAVGEVTPRFVERGAEIGLAGTVALRYRPRSQAVSAADLLAELEQRRNSDLERGFSGHGPHRDDLVLELGGRSLRSYGSQGQQRAALLALLFAERDVLVEAGRPPLMLLDDVMSELDAARRSQLVGLIESGGQALLTATEAAHVPADAAADVIHVNVTEGVAEVAQGLRAA